MIAVSVLAPLVEYVVYTPRVAPGALTLNASAVRSLEYGPEILQHEMAEQRGRRRPVRQQVVVKIAQRKSAALFP